MDNIEYGSEGLVSTRCDVYSYGILLMETFTRTKPSSDIFFENVNLKSWVKDSLPDKVIDVIDANLIAPNEEHSERKNQVLVIYHGIGFEVLRRISGG